MPKLPKVKVFFRFYKGKKKGIQLYPLADILSFMLKISDASGKDGAKRHHNFSHF